MKTNDYVILIHDRGDYLTGTGPGGELRGGSAEDAIGYTLEEARQFVAEMPRKLSFELRSEAVALTA